MDKSDKFAACFQKLRYCDCANWYRLRWNGTVWDAEWCFTRWRRSETVSEHGSFVGSFRLISVIPVTTVDVVPHFQVSYLLDFSSDPPFCTGWYSLVQFEEARNATSQASRIPHKLTIKFFWKFQKCARAKPITTDMPTLFSGKIRKRLFALWNFQFRFCCGFWYSLSVSGQFEPTKTGSRTTKKSETCHPVYRGLNILIGSQHIVKMQAISFAIRSVTSRNKLLCFGIVLVQFEMNLIDLVQFEIIFADFQIFSQKQTSILLFEISYSKIPCGQLRACGHFLRWGYWPGEIFSWNCPNNLKTTTLKLYHRPQTVPRWLKLYRPRKKMENQVYTPRNHHCNCLLREPHSQRCRDGCGIGLATRMDFRWISGSPAPPKLN